MNLMREYGFYVEVVERYNSFTKQKYDLLGFADLLALKRGQPPTLIQVTSWDNVSSRIRKITGDDRAALAIECGFRVLVHGWGYKTDPNAHGTDQKSMQGRVHVVSLDKNGQYLVDDKEIPTV